VRMLFENVGCPLVEKRVRGVHDCKSSCWFCGLNEFRQVSVSTTDDAFFCEQYRVIVV